MKRRKSKSQTTLLFTADRDIIDSVSVYLFPVFTETTEIFCTMCLDY